MQNQLTHDVFRWISEAARACTSLLPYPNGLNDLYQFKMRDFFSAGCGLTVPDRVFYSGPNIIL